MRIVMQMCALCCNVHSRRAAVARFYTLEALAASRALRFGCSSEAERQYWVTSPANDDKFDAF